MDINVQIHGRSARISAVGRFDFKVHRDFQDAYKPLLDNPALREIEIEMDKLVYIDSSALGMLLQLDERARAVNKTIALLNTSGTVSKMLDVANFSKLFNIRHTD